MANHPHPAAVKAEFDRLTEGFFRAVSFEEGSTPLYESIYELFIEAGLLIKNTSSTPEISTVSQFIEPRLAAVRSGDLIRFNEVELCETTESFGQRRASLQLVREVRNHEGNRLHGARHGLHPICSNCGRLENQRHGVG